MTIQNINKIKANISIVQGILIIAIGIIWLVNYMIGSYTVYIDNPKLNWIIGSWAGWLIMGVCVWRGVVAFRSRNKKSLSYIMFGLWLLLFGASLFYILHFTLPVYSYYLSLETVPWGH